MLKIFDGLYSPRVYACVVVYQDAYGEWAWQLFARNKRIVAASAEGYTQKADAKRAFRRVEKMLAQRRGREGPR